MISIAHLIPAPFTQQVARALDEAGLLDTFYCTLVDQPEKSWQRVAKAGSRLVRFDLETNLKRRAVTEIDRGKVETYPFREAFRMFATKINKDPVVGDRIFHWARDGFDHWVAGRLNGSKVLYGYEYGSRAMFEAAKRQGIRTAYDLPSPEHQFVENLLAPEFERFPELATPYRQLTVERHAERTERRRQEWELSDLIVANSNFTADSWKAAGWSEKTVAVVPYGAPPVTHPCEEAPAKDVLRFLWAGTFSIRKGAHYLIDAIRSMPAAEAKGFTLDVYGAVTLPEALLKNLPPQIRFMGSVPRSVLFEKMREGDLLVFPTLCDGFGLVVNEALAQGMPVLTTPRAGAADLIREDENGWLIPPADAAALAAGLTRVIQEQKRLPGMRLKAQATARDWQWSDYRREIAKAVGALIGK
ncbi:glycosyltransferase family 4 protein [Luteolibacter luteus]|uniref:Glycosyltransferase family 4 protein n=1 Tax=Luteolibacter luteus TaxID=2728835 RepID=A0A858RBC0_9BACT|nr:glycosyltransferase family 4 protein [Luteolibacter luteus]QJE94286.1 glycosyltransferase family 4 protein [Luteolibacter luteus]